MFHRVKSEVQNQEEVEQTEVETAVEEQEIEIVEPTEIVSASVVTEEEIVEVATEEVEEAAVTASSTYQRSGTPAGYTAAPYAAAGSKSPTAYATSPSAPSATTADYTEGERRLTIGRGITMSGEIESCDYLLVEGTVEAALKGAAALDIAESGVFYGTVEIENATIAGRFEGDLVVSGRLTIRSSGVVTGSISYAELAIEAGAIIDGRLTPIVVKQPVIQAAPKAVPVTPVISVSKAAKSVNKIASPANTDGQLFSAKVTAAE